MPSRSSRTSCPPIVTITATGFNGLYWGTFIFALAGGAIEAAVNPITATLYPRSKTHHLNILHAGWPAGLVIGGVLAIALGTARRRERLALESRALSHPGRECMA